MDKVTFYKQKVRSIIEKYVSNIKLKLPNEEVYAVTDDEHGHYLIFRSVWQQSRSYGYFLHVRIKNEKVYVEYDGTDYDMGFTGFFLEEGIPKEDIVLSFHHPAARQYTGFAVA